MAGLSKNLIQKLIKELNEELLVDGISGEVYLVGGAVMCLAFETRQSTKDIDGAFSPKNGVKKAALRVATKNNLKEDWLNDAAKGFFSEKRDFRNFLEFSNLKIFIPTTEYLFAMKCLAMRLGEEFSDEDDIRFLIRSLNITSYERALEIISAYYPVAKFPQKTFYFLEELLGK